MDFMWEMKKTSTVRGETQKKAGDDSTKATIKQTDITPCLTLFPMEKRYQNCYTKIKGKIVHS